MKMFSMSPTWPLRLFRTEVVLLRSHKNQVVKLVLRPGLCSVKTEKHTPVPYRYEQLQPAAAVDWRPKGIIGPIKDQHANGSACGCCWAFATIGTAECMVAMATGKVLSLSEQQVQPAPLSMSSLHWTW